MPLVGSSRKIAREPPINAIDRDNFLFCPPDSELESTCRFSVRPTALIDSSATARISSSVTPFKRPNVDRCCITVNCAYNTSCCDPDKLAHAKEEAQVTLAHAPEGKILCPHAHQPYLPRRFYHTQTHRQRWALSCPLALRSWWFCLNGFYDTFQTTEQRIQQYTRVCLMQTRTSSVVTQQAEDLALVHGQI